MNRARLSGFDRLEDRTVPTLLDLTGGIGLSGFINGANFESVHPQPTGTGVIDPFVRVQRSPSNPSGMEHGYNTDGIEEFDTKDAGGHNWNHSLKLSSLQEVNGFYQFTLDVNETKPGALISLDELQVFVQGDPNLTGVTFKPDGSGTITSFKKPKNNGFTTVQASLVYDLDGAHVQPGPSPNGDSSVLLNYFLNHGSGSGDMTVKIPKALFPAVRGQQYVYLYSKFGQDVPGAGSESGFEEWTALLGGGSVGPFSLSGHKFEDLNGDGNIVGDPPVANWEFKLYKETDGVTGWSLNDTYIGSDLTDANGLFEFTSLAAGLTYYTVENIPNGWIQTYGGNVENGANDFYSTLLNADVPDLDFGNFELVDITGKKWNDRTGNGVTSDDTGLGGITINLYVDANQSGTLDGPDGNPVRSTTTASDGTYSFADLGLGSYFVQEVVPVGSVQTGGPSYYTVIVGGSGVPSGGTSTGNDFANFTLFDLCGVKYRDIDKDGVKDVGEPLLNGWTIFLDGSNGSTPNGVLDTGEKSTVTGPGGAYCFTDLGPGTYLVREVLKPNWQQYSANPDPITGISGVDVNNVDFGNAMINPGVGRTKGYWHNQNGHATIELLGGWNDPGEGPLTAVQLALKDLCLRNSDGSLFFAGNYAQNLFDGFLTNDTNASNMANMLSAQAAAALLNSMAGNAGLTVEGQTFASGDTLLSVSTAVSATGYITVGELLARAEVVLCTGGAANLVIDSSHSLHAYAEALKSALDAFNNNSNIVNA